MAGKVTAKKNKKVLSPLRPGNNVFIRTVTMYYVGKVVAVDRKTREILLENSSWVAETGVKLSEMFTKPFDKPAEVEPMPGIVSVALDVVVDVADWRQPLPDKSIGGQNT